MSGEVKLSIRRMSQEARSRITTAVGISMKNGFPNKGFVKDIALEDCRIGNNGQLNRHAKVVAKIFFHAWHSVSFGSERAKILRKRREQELFESRQRELQAVLMPLLKSTLASWKQFTQLSKDGCLPADQNVEESTNVGDFLWKSLQVKITGGEHNKRHTAYQRLKRKIQLAQAMERLSRRARAPAAAAAWEMTSFDRTVEKMKRWSASRAGRRPPSPRAWPCGGPPPPPRGGATGARPAPPPAFATPVCVPNESARTRRVRDPTQKGTVSFRPRQSETDCDVKVDRISACVFQNESIGGTQVVHDPTDLMAPAIHII